MYRVAAMMVIIGLTLGALTSCETGGAQPGAPGSITAYVHGRTDVIIGHSIQ